MAIDDAVMAVIKASRPSFRTGHDKIAFALHSTLLASGYTLVATGAAAYSDTVFYSPPSDEVGIEGWNETEDSYGFVYSKDEKGLKRTVLIKCLTMGDCLVIDALCSKDEDNEISLQINVSDYDGGDESTNYADRYKNFGSLVKTLNSQIVSKLGNPPAKSTASPALSRPERIDRSEQNRREPQDPEPYQPGFVIPPVPTGHNDDLFPGPGAGVYPRRGPDMGGPMLIGPNDPRWFRPAQPGFPDLDGSSVIPPGARYDPIGPSGVPGFEPNRFIRNPRRPGGGTHPDLEHFGNPDFI